MFNQTGVKVAVGSFSIGIIILFSFLISGQSIFARIGLFYLFVAIIVNVIALLYLIIEAIFNRQNVLPNFYTALLILGNIPVAFLCAYIGISNLS